MTPSPPGIPEEDYDAIEAAVMETARGRWFLMEFARRNRTADTKVLLEAIQRLEHQMGSGKYLPPSPHQPVHDGAVVTSAAAELFAVEPPPPSTALTLPPIAEQPELAWVDEQHDPIDMNRAIEPDIFELDDDLIVPTHATVTAAPAAPAPRPSTPPPAPAQLAPAPVSFATPETPRIEAARTDAPRAEPALAAAPAQSRMLAGALAQAGAVAQAEEAMARASEPAPPPPPTSFSPPPAEPLELDALSFEEKSVYFG
jgi:hypothetical protein